MASIRKRVDGQGRRRFQVTWREGGGRDGRQQWATLPTETAAKRFRARVEANGNRWPPDDATADMVTVSEWAERWLGDRTGITERTRHDDKRDLKRHALPVLGEIEVEAVTREDVKRWVRRLEGKLAPKTVKNLHSTLSTMFRDAALAGLRVDNPCRGVPLPRVDRAGETACFLSPAEFALISDAATDPALLVTLAGTGLRWSEATALEVRHVDLDQSRLTVAQAWKRMPDSTSVLGPPKTRRSRRTLTLDPTVIAALKPLVDGRRAGEPLFTSPLGGPVRHGNFRYRVWVPAVAKAQENGLEKTPRIHDLRHTHASWLIAAGVPLPKIQERLGHESIVTTIDRYGHLAPDDDLGVSDAITRALSTGPKRRRAGRGTRR